MDDRHPKDVPSELRAFLYSCIDAVEQVEILTLLCRSAKPRSARAVALELHLTDISARHHLETLVARGLLQTAVGPEVQYTYGPKSADLRRYGDQLTEFYTHSRTSILRFIAATPRRAKRFSDAFNLREPEK